MRSSPYGNGAMLELLGNLLAAQGGAIGGKGTGKKGKGGGKQVHGDPSCIVRVKNIAYGSAWQDLKDHMKTAGTVEFCEIDSIGDASVRYASQSEAQTALQLLNGSNFNGRPLKLEGPSGSSDLGDAQIHGDPACMVSVSNLKPGARWQDLKDHMRAAGTVEFCDISQGSSVVRYASQAEAQVALQLLNGSDFSGYPLQLDAFTGPGGDQVLREGSNFTGRPFRPEVFNGLGGAQVHGEPACMVGVGNLASGSAWQDLKDHMRTAGNVDFVEIKNGMACVRYSSMAEAQTAIINLNGSNFRGRAITVEAWPGNSGSDSLAAMQSAIQPAFKPGNIMGNAGKGNAGKTQVHGDPACMVWVGNLQSGTRWQDLKDLMRTAGSVEFCNILTQDDIEWGAPAGSACVRYASQTEALMAIDALNGMNFNGRSIVVALLSNISGGCEGQ